MPMPNRNVHFDASNTAHPREPLNPTASPLRLEHDTYRTSGLLEGGPPAQSGDSKFAPLIEEYSSEESTPFFEIEDNCTTARVPTLLSRWLRRWKTQRRRSSFSHRRKTNASSIQGVHGQSLQYTSTRRPSLIRCTLYLLGLTLMLL
jgi:hypothetical protein